MGLKEPADVTNIVAYCDFGFYICNVDTVDLDLYRQAAREFEAYVKQEQRERNE